MSRVLSLGFAAPFKWRPTVGNSFGDGPNMHRPDATPVPTARASPHIDMGWRTDRRRPQTADRSPASRSAPASARPSRRFPRARHPARASRHPLTPIAENVHRRPWRDRSFVGRHLSHLAVFRSRRSRASDRRGRRRRRPLTGDRRAEDSHRSQHQPRSCASGPALGRSVSRARAAHASRGSRRADLRPAELEEAHSPRRRPRRALVRGLV